VTGAGPVTGYVLQYRLTNSATWTTVNLSATTTTRVTTRLRAGASYAFRVAARNAAGIGSFTNEAVVTA
jgi:titin